MPSTTSLLKSAASTRKKVQQQADALVAFEWQNSAQTYDEFLEYSKYLEKRQSETSDPSEALSIAKTITSARRSFVSNELQREQMAIMEGRATTRDKMEAVYGLYQQAIENGDYNLAQNLASQWDNLSVKLQNEQETAARAFAASGEKAMNSLLNDLQKGFDEVTLPTGERVTPLAAIAEDLETTGGSDATWKAAQDTMSALASVIIDSYNNATSQEQVDKLEEKYGPGLQNLDEKITFEVGGKKLTAQQVVNAAANEALNNPVYSLEAVRNEATGQNEFRLKENNVERLDYVRQLDEKGEEYYVPATIRTDQPNLFFGTSDQGRGLNTQITNEGAVIGGNVGGQGNKAVGNINAGEGQVNRDESQTIGNRLKNIGIIARQNGTTLAIKLPGESVERQATIQPDASIRYYDDNGQLVEIGLVDRNLGSDTLPQFFQAGQPRVVSPEEISDFGQASAFGGQLSRASAQGQRYISDIVGKTAAPQKLTTNTIQVGNNFSGFGTAVSSNLLQSAGAVKQNIQMEKQRVEMLQAQERLASQLQASGTFNLNQTPVQQLTGNGILKRQLQVSAPAPPPRIYVAPPPVTPRITSVGVAQPRGRITVGVANGGLQGF